MEDREILRLYRSRSEQAIAETGRKYGALCHRIAMNVLGSREDAEECVSDAYHTLWNRIPPENPLSLPAFLGRVTRNLAISRYRAAHARKRFSALEVMLGELDECVPSAMDVEQVLDQKALSALISDWLDGLSEADSALFVRRYWYGDSVRSLAELVGCTPNQMAQRMRKLRQNLRKFLEQEGISL